MRLDGRKDIQSVKSTWSFCIQILTLSLPVTRCAGHSTDLHSNSNISKTVRVNNAFNLFKRVFDKLSNGIQIDRLCTCGSLVIDV